MASCHLDKQTAGCNLPRDWLMSLAIDLVAAFCYVFGSENGTNGRVLPVFSVGVVFTHHFVATHPSTTLLLYRSASGIGYTSKTLSTMASNSAYYSLNS